jgi:hypothetical protein
VTNRRYSHTLAIFADPFDTSPAHISVPGHVSLQVAAEQISLLPVSSSQNTPQKSCVALPLPPLTSRTQLGLPGPV